MSETYCNLNGYAERAECRTCAFRHIRCIFRYKSYAEAEKYAEKNDIRRKRQLEENTQRLKKLNKRLSEKAKQLEETKELEQEKVQVSEQIVSQVDYGTIIGGIAMIVLLGFPVQYFGQLIQVFADFFVDSVDLFFGTEFNDHSEFLPPFEKSFFYADFKSRYLYWTSLMLTLWCWTGDDLKSLGKDEQEGFRWIVTMLFAIIALFNFQLVLACIFGPIIILIGLLVNVSKRR